MEKGASGWVWSEEKKQENKDTPHPKHKDPLRCLRHRENPPHGYQGGGGQTPTIPPASQPKTLNPQEPLERTEKNNKEKGERERGRVVS